MENASGNVPSTEIIKSNANIDIYDISDEIVKTLASLNKIHVSSSAFNKLTENHQKVKFAEDLLLKFEHLQKFKFNLVLQNSKSNERSIAFRKEGNENFSLKSRNYFRALELYNKSICYSLSDSENISIGYANRSAVLFELKKYQQCLENISMARASGFPERLRHKLDKRENDCKKLLPTQVNEFKPYEFSLSFDKHPTVPFIANCLEIDSSKEEGRFIYTKNALKPGDVVAIESPFCTALLPPMRYIRCAYCTQENCFTLIPCENCTSAMFCNADCRNKAWNEFHKYECPIIDFLFDCCPKIQLTALRTCFRILSLFPSIEECKAFCQNPDNNDKTVFDLNYAASPIDLEECKAINGLVTNEGKRLVNDLFQRATVCATIKHILLESTPFKDYLGDNLENINFFTELFFKHLQTSSSNMHSIDLVEHVGETPDDENFATGAFPFLSLLNHSCAPNVVRIHKDTTALLFVLRPIEANGKLFDSYGYHFAFQSKSVRQKKLSSQYRFNCKCEACENDYGHFRSLPKQDIPDSITENDIEYLKKLDSQYALENFEKYIDYLRKYGGKSYPCDQLCSAEECLKMALKILVCAIPLKANQQNH